ncbi:unnamed protein product [Peniophora sp. CBMAI 1063]|nr:unnamed protein product [Peniophora sp. CBMAI 1063]
MRIVAMLTVKDLPREFTLTQIKDLIKDGHALYEPNDYGQVTDVGNDLFVKYGSRILKTEALAMELVRTRTNLPVPGLLAYISDEGDDATERPRCGYLVMKKLPGIRLDRALEGMDKAAEDIVAQGIRHVLSELRSLDDPGRWGHVGKNGALHGGEFKFRLSSDDPKICRPSSMQDLLDFTIAATGMEKLESFLQHPNLKARQEAQRCITMLASIDMSRPSVFSHGDLRPENILVDPETYAITGIIDWELAGWYPYFWNYSIAEFYQDQARFRAPATIPIWERIYKSAMPDYERESQSFGFLLTDIAFRGQDWGWLNLPCDCCKD